MKRDVPSAYFGIIVGLSLGFVLCNVLHAEQVCPDTLDAEAERCRDEAYRDMLSRAFGSLRPNPISAYESDLLNCYVQMEAAMRAMDEFVYREPSMTNTAIADMCIYDAVCMATRELARVSRRTDAAKQWEQAKACWRKP